MLRQLAGNSFTTTHQPT